MRPKLVGILALMMVMFAFPTIASAAEIELYSVLYPERTRTPISFVGKKAAPAADLSAVVEATKGQSKITIKFTGMKPAILFGGEISSFVVWAVSKDGASENLGELWVRDANGESQFQTGLRDFALVVTAEAFPGKRKPSERVVFVSLPAQTKGVQTTPFKFSNFGYLGTAETESITGLEYKGSDPIDLVQARRVYELAMSYGAASYEMEKMEQAKVTLTQAENLAKGRDLKTMVDYCRRTIALSSDAIREAATRKAAEQVAAEEARRQAELTSLESAATRAAAEAERSALEAARVSAQLQEVEQQRALLAKEKTAIQMERDELAARLEGALGQVASTTASARGLVVNLGDILFDVNKATLKADTQQTVAKLAGILLMMPKMNVRIEGHTDSTGKEDANMKLSEARAKAVSDLLNKHGIPAERLASQGYGPKIPVADNTTKEGRAKNRRVEVVINEGAIQGADAAPAPPAM